MEVTNVSVYPVNGASKLKANGSLTLSNAVELKFVIIEGPKGPFVSWKGTTSYDKKDGSGKGYDSPIFIKDAELNKSVSEAVMAKYKSVGAGGASRPAASAGRGQQSSRGGYTPSAQADFTGDEIPF